MWITNHEGRTVNLAAFHEIVVVHVPAGCVVQAQYCPGLPQQFVVDLTEPLQQDAARDVLQKIMAEMKQVALRKEEQTWFIV